MNAIEKAYFTQEFGKEIFMLHFDYETIQEAVPVIEACAEQIQQRPENSVLTLTTIAGGRFNAELVEYLKVLTKGNAPYVRKAAVVGIDGLYRVVISAISIFSKREFQLFDTREDAIAYLLAD